MLVRQLKLELKRIRRSHLRHYRGVFIYKPKLYFFTGNSLFKRLHALEYNDWNIEEFEDGRWRVFYEERGEKSFISEYASEDEACDAFLKTIMKSTLR